MKARKKQIQTKWSMLKGPGHHLLVPIQYMEVGHGSRYSKGVVWWWGEKGVYFKVPAQASLEEMSYWDDISPKIGKYGLRPLDTCHRGR